MRSKKDHPGVYIPPPLLYVAVFLTAVFMQKLVPVDRGFFDTPAAKTIGVTLIVISLLFIFPALRQFLRTRNTLITIKAASSLLTAGVYSISRNPMYVSLLFIYTGLSFIIGSWWNLIPLPLLMLIVQEYVIKREEKYLQRRFEQEYLDYKAKVRRWL